MKLFEIQDAFKSKSLCVHVSLSWGNPKEIHFVFQKLNTKQRGKPCKKYQKTLAKKKTMCTHQVEKSVSGSRYTVRAILVDSAKAGFQISCCLFDPFAPSLDCGA